ncbi:4-hydroxy-3-methylbut-2-enyl diphosphate reductase [Saccharopolyspora phatthalungensis]|uniref:4-hydroxy-3-methylbut-2-enyl diphosphate reductase n=1 Tax=Saccharopolyspora phatthalungensis TaxID=664693 RepID=A0A840Q7U0_9PSEU|nr:4-hydroxy-3-methylbut-2-enyl diphosphate reductase [Saccharopolyspora phatthalungensis]MBB5156516.1 4-hydroxy-3-methylbut-2-enyl diphosphate reductase [Saccharopolyspora phatthalungensis]
MHPLVWHIRATPADPAPSDAVLVASSYRLVDRLPSDCAAAPLLVGELRRHGISAVSTHVDVGVGEQIASAPRGGDIDLLAIGADQRSRTIVDSVLGSWLSVAAPRTVLLASPRSFCAGVERAIGIVERALEQAEGSPVYVRKEIVHNKHVVRDLEKRGAVFVNELHEVPDDVTVVFSAHGVSPAVRDEADRRGLRVIDGTCPLVSKVHSEARRYAGRGDTVVLIGHRGHEEVEGTFGEAPDQTVIVETVSDVDNLSIADPSRVSYLTQTTLAVDETADVVEALRAKFSALRGAASDDICYATTNRQSSLRAVADQAGLVLVVGSANSSNSVRLVELAERGGTPAHRIDDVTDIRPEWLAEASVVGLTAGASAPPNLIEEIVRALGGLGPLDVRQIETTTETIHFGLPSAVLTLRE